MTARETLAEMLHIGADSKITIDVATLYRLGLIDIPGVEREPTEADILWAQESADRLQEEGRL